MYLWCGVVGEFFLTCSLHFFDGEGRGDTYTAQFHIVEHLPIQQNKLRFSMEQKQGRGKLQSVSQNSKNKNCSNTEIFALNLSDDMI